MKNILIPTTFLPDTANALKNAISHANGADCNVILFQLIDAEQNYSASATLRCMQNELSPSQKENLELCRYIVETEKNCHLKIHTQYSLSAPLLKNVMESLSIDLVILSDSFKNSQTSINKYCTKLLSNCKYPILHVGKAKENIEFSKALYLENQQSQMQVEDLQQLVNMNFNFRIVSSAKVLDGQDSNELIPLLTETISKNNIDLLVETRKPEKIKFSKKQKTSYKENFDLPVLSLYEKIM